MPMLTEANIRIEEAVKDAMHLAVLEAHMTNGEINLINRIDERRDYEDTIEHLSELVAKMPKRDLVTALVLLAHGVDPKAVRGPPALVTRPT